MQKVVFIFGPTGVGKSKMAINLAKNFNGEIISSDSVQIYKGFDIGSAKIKKIEMEGVKHYNIDICEPTEYFTVSDFVTKTRKEIEEISSMGKLPIVVGGTGLYVSALLGGYNFGGTQRNIEFRENLEREINVNGLDWGYEKLKQLDKTLAENIDKNNKVRLIRALEIATFGQKQSKEDCPYDYKIFALNLPREMLYQRINLRVEQMLQEGLVEEVKTLLASYDKTCQAMGAIGYKETIEYIEGKISISEMQEKIKQNSRHYAKRQLTYLRGLSKRYKVDEIEVKDYEEGKLQIEHIIKEWL